MLASLMTAAPAEAKRGAATFEGRCSFEATVSFEPPLSATPQDERASARGHGACTGTLTTQRGRRSRRRELNAAPTGYVAWSNGSGSCQGGTAEGGGYLMFRGARLRFRLSEVRVGPAAALTLEGALGGSAAGTARVSPDTDPAQVVERCIGAGLARAEVEIDIASTPAISG